MARDLEDRSVIVTGASGGVGSACARLFASHGAKLTLVDRNEASLSALAAEINTEALTLALDVTSEDDMVQMASRTVERFGGIDTLVAAAGILRTGGEPRTVIDTSYDEWRTVIEVNLTGTFLSNRAVLADMLKRGSGDIVNISSTTGRQGRAFDAPYAASKSGIIGLSEFSCGRSGQARRPCADTSSGRCANFALGSIWNHSPQTSAHAVSRPGSRICAVSDHIAERCISAQSHALSAPGAHETRNAAQIEEPNKQ